MCACQICTHSLFFLRHVDMFCASSRFKTCQTRWLRTGQTLLLVLLQFSPAVSMHGGVSRCGLMVSCIPICKLRLKRRTTGSKNRPVHCPRSVSQITLRGGAPHCPKGPEPDGAGRHRMGHFDTDTINAPLRACVRRSRGKSTGTCHNYQPLPALVGGAIRANCMNALPGVDRADQRP